MRAGRQSSSGLAVTFGWCVVALLSVSSVLGMVNRSEFGPHVGDIISFAPAPDAPSDVSARIMVARAGGGACSLDFGLIQQGGGSLVIEARRPDLAQPYQAHWAGPGDSDCGRSADLLVSDSDMSLLAIAAGGYGVGGKRLTPTPPLGTPLGTPLTTSEALVP